MRALTVRQPWAWAIVHGGKDVENRTRNLAGSYRGPVAIHAGAQISDEGMHSDLVREAWDGPTRTAHRRDRFGWVEVPDRRLLTLGAFVGVVDLVDVHLSRPARGATTTGQPMCFDDGTPIGRHCSPWADDTTDERWHLVLANPRPLARPIPCRGRLGLWTPPADVLEQLREVA